MGRRTDYSLASSGPAPNDMGGGMPELKTLHLGSLAMFMAALYVETPFL